MISPSLIYIVEARIGVCKIGCSATPLQRLATIRTHSPVLTRLVAMWPGQVADEQALHRRFEPHRQHSEWFQIEGALAELLADIRGLGLDRVEDWSELTFVPMNGRDARVRAGEGA